MDAYPTFFTDMENSVGTATYIATIVANGILGSSILIFKKKEAFMLPTFAFILSVFSLIFWTSANYLADTSEGDSALFWTRATFPLAIIMGLSFLIFSSNFPKGIPSLKIVMFAAILLGIPCFYWSLSESIVRSVTTDPHVGISSVHIGERYYLYLSYAWILLSAIITTLFLQFRRSKGSAEKQIRSVSIGMGVFFFGSITTNLVLPFLTGHAIWSKFGPLFSIIMVGCVAYAIIYHHFLDIRVIVQRGFIYTVLAAITLSAYFSLISLSGFIFGGTTETGFLLSGALSAMFGALSAKPIERYLREKTDHIFFKGRYDLGEALREIGDIAQKSMIRTDVAEETSSALKRILRAESVTFVFFDDEHASPGTPEGNSIDGKEIGFLRSNRDMMLCSDSDCRIIKISRNSTTFRIIHVPAAKSLRLKTRVTVIIPLIHERGIIGSIMIGPKRSGDAYTPGDLRFLSSVTPHVTAAMEKARLYEEEREYLETLEERVRERTRELLSLQESQRETMIDIAHNLQSPFTAVKGTLDLIRPENENQRKNLSAAKRSVDRVTKFVYDLLALARFETLNKDVPIVETDLREVLSDLAEEYTVTTAEDDVSITLAAPEKSLVTGNRHLLEQLFGNIMGNAVKYRKPGEHLDITMSIVDGNDGTTVSICDTGIGISEDETRKVFERYRRAGRSSLAHGSGLGLAIAEKIAQRHGGIISVESELGKGSCFSVRFTKKRRDRTVSGASDDPRIH